jgi:hypothetical protein
MDEFAGPATACCQHRHHVISTVAAQVAPNLEAREQRHGRPRGATRLERFARPAAVAQLDGRRQSGQTFIGPVGQVGLREG